MKFRPSYSAPVESPYAPSWGWVLGQTSFPINVDKLSQTCLSKEKEIKKLPVSYFNSADGGAKDEGMKIFDGNTGLGKNSTTSRSLSYNVLSWDTPEIRNLKKHIKVNVRAYNKELGNPTPEKIWVQCWMNILRFSQKIKPHLHAVHPASYLSAHFTIKCKHTSTIYISPVNQISNPEIYEEKNVENTFTVFPSYVPHYTTPHYSLSPRITLAMDISLHPITETSILL